MSAGRTRLVLAATCYAEARAALAPALALAEGSGTLLEALLVEEEAHALLSAHPGVRLLSPGGWPMPPAGIAQMTAALRADAARLERDLAAAARRARLHWSLARRAGRMPAILRELASPGDLVVLGGSPLVASPGDVVLLAGPRSDPGLGAVAARLASALRRPLWALVPGTAPPPSWLHDGDIRRAPDRAGLAQSVAALGADMVLVADLADAPFDLLPATGPARFTRVLRVSAAAAETGGA